MKIAGISSKAFDAPKNPYQYQGDYSEYDDETQWNEFALRNYDPQIGRFVQADPYDQFPSPYTGMGNDPINNVDPSGGWIFSAVPLIEHGAWAIGGAVAGTVIAGAASGWDTKAMANGALIGGGVGLGASFVNWGSVAGAIGDAGKWVGNNVGGLLQGGTDGVVALVGGADLSTNGGIADVTKNIENDLNKFYKENNLKVKVKSFSSDPAASTMDDVYNYLKKNSKKSRPLFVYGYSLGGHTANQAIKRLNADDIGVNLFYAVDAALGLLSKGMEISSNVEQVINVYQTDVSTPPAFSRGYPANAINGNTKTKITNVNYDAYKSKQGFGSHGAMAGDLQESVTRTFQNQMKFLITGN